MLFFLAGNAGLRSHFPARFERVEDRGETEDGGEEEEEGQEVEEEEGGGREDDRLAEGPAEQAGMSMEVQIGRKLREIGDKFQQDHVEPVSLNEKKTKKTFCASTPRDRKRGTRNKPPAGTRAGTTRGAPWQGQRGSSSNSCWEPLVWFSLGAKQELNSPQKMAPQTKIVPGSNILEFQSCPSRQRRVLL